LNSRKIMNKSAQAKTLILVTLCSMNALFGQLSFDQLMSNGVRADEKGQYDEALINLNLAVDAKPEDDMAWLTRGIVRIHMSDFSSAVVDFNKAIYLNPSRSKSYLYRYIAYSRTENYQFAFGDINHYLGLAPSDTLGRVYRLEIALKLKEYDAVNEDMVWLYKTMGDFFLKDYLPILSTHFDASKKYTDFQKILIGLKQINPKEMLISESLIQNTYQMGQFELCLTQVDEILKQDPQNQSLLKLKADALFYLNHIAESEAIYQTLLAGAPNDGDLMADYGHCLLQLERYNDADLWLSKSIKSKNSTPAYAYLGRGIARYNMGKIGVACADWERSLLLGEKSASKWLEKHCQENPTNK